MAAVGGGAKRPGNFEKENLPRKRTAAEEDYLIEASFDLEEEDEIEDLPAAALEASAAAAACLRRLSTLARHGGRAPRVTRDPCRWTRSRWARRAKTGSARRRQSSTRRPTGWVRAVGGWLGPTPAACSWRGLLCRGRGRPCTNSPPRPRPTLPAPAAVFQQLEVDYTFGKPHPVYYPSDLREVPIVRMFGVTEAGNSVCAFVHGFEPYFYVESPTAQFSPDDCQSLAAKLNVRGGGRAGGQGLLCCAVRRGGGGAQRHTRLPAQPPPTRPAGLARQKRQQAPLPARGAGAEAQLHELPAPGLAALPQGGGRGARPPC